MDIHAWNSSWRYFIVVLNLGRDIIRVDVIGCSHVSCQLYIIYSTRDTLEKFNIFNKLFLRS